ncbi:jg11878 [Pararge aegeria aegeria]|uniref:Jg11878 protein n=1 Tax=Pararge aegeria aegeria TaxID=348720 RepID=A0A8S4SJX9_9NEOP|nr:jg11878 [Pararge aegeria aegeria]
MKILCVLIVACALWEANGYPYPYYGSNADSISYGSTDINRGGVALSRYYNPYYNPRAYGGGMAAFMFKPEERYQPQTSQYYLPDRRRQTQPESNYPQQNEVYYPQLPEQSERLPEQPVIQENPIAIPELPTITEATEIVEPNEKSELGTTTLKSVVPELTEPESEEIPKPAPKKRVTKKKQVKRPVEEEEDEGEDYPKMPTGAYFPMFFGLGGRSSNGGAPGGATAIANAFSTGRGGVATSHATAYGLPRSESKRL